MSTTISLQQKRVSRWDDNQPVIRAGRPHRIIPTARMKREVFALLDPRLGRTPWAYSVLPLDYIHALAPGWDRGYLGDRLPLFCRPPNRYLRRPRSQLANFRANSRCQVYAHADQPLKETEFWHELMANMVIANIEVGVRADPGYEIVNFARLTAGPQMPGGVTPSQTISVTVPDKQVPVRVTSDWEPFLIGKAGRFNAYFGIEADRSTEPLTTKSYCRKSITGMLKSYLEIDAQGLSQKLFGIPYFYYPIVTSGPERLKSMVDLVYALTDGRGHPRFLFASFPAYNADESPPAADGALFRTAWKRAWKSDFNMNGL